MGRAPCCDKANVKRGPWSPEEDATLKSYLETHGTAGNWIALPKKAGLRRCGKSCRLRWLNYLRPDIKHGGFTDEEDTIICTLYAQMGSRWSAIASQLPGRTDNDVKNYWNTKLKKKIMAGTVTLKPLTENKDIGLASTPSPTHQNVKSTQKYAADFPASQNQINSSPSPPLPILDNNNYDVASSGFNNIDELKNMGFDQIHQLYSPRVLMDVVSSEIGANYANSSNNNNNNNNVPMGSLSQDGSSIVSDSSSNIAVNNNCVSLPAEEYAHAGETLMDFGFGFPNYDYVNNGLNNCHERVGDFNAAGCCYPEWVDFSYADMKPH